MQKRLNNLDGLRFLAAWIVLVCHIEVLKPVFGNEPIGWRFFSNSAQLAVTFFFVLSGFLITWLLLKEKKTHPSDRVNIWRFYKKRILRIWPLYYLLVLLVFFVFRHIALLNIFQGPAIPSDHDLTNKRLIGYLLFCPNFTELNLGKELYLGQTWSLGVEEFFYLFFPLLLYFTKWRNVRAMLLILVGLFFILSLGIKFFQPRDGQSGNYSGLLAIYLDRYRIYSFALGGLAAWVLLNQDKTATAFMRICRNKNMARSVLALTGILVAGGITFSLATQQIYSILFALLLLSLTVSGTRFAWLDHPVTVYLGKISYGIYMLHPIALVLVLKLLKPAGGNVFASAILPIVLGTLGTIAMAAVSYELYENYFLRLRTKVKA